MKIPDGPPWFQFEIISKRALKNKNMSKKDFKYKGIQQYEEEIKKLKEEIKRLKQTNNPK